MLDSLQTIIGNILRFRRFEGFVERIAVYLQPVIKLHNKLPFSVSLEPIASTLRQTILLLANGAVDETRTRKITRLEGEALTIRVTTAYGPLFL